MRPLTPDAPQYAQAVKAHAALRQRLEQIDARLTQQAGVWAALEPQLDELARQLARLWDEEALGSLLAQLVARAPHLAHRADALRQGHARLVQQAEQLGLRGAEVAAAGGRLAADFHALRWALTDSQRQINGLVQDAFSLDLGAED
jgi:hypothetical protein